MDPRRPVFPLNSFPGEGLVAMRSQPTKPESLGEYVRRVRDGLGLSLMDVERQSARHGKKIAGSYVNRIENDISANPSKDRLISLAHGLGVPVAEIMAVASGKPLSKLDAQEERLLGMFRSLPPEQQDDIMQLVRVLEKKYGLSKSGRRAA